MRLGYVIFIIAVACHSLCFQLAGADSIAQKKLNDAVEKISQSDLKTHVDILADDTFEGRAAGTRGGRAAAGYLRKNLLSLGLMPGGINGGFSQPFRQGCQNILAIVPGIDPALNKEYIVIGAHYDHVGYGSRQNSYGPTGFIHNGADDNASGTAALLELAEALMINPCRRSVLIAFWDGEEQGLWGSKHFVANPTIPIKDIRLALNMDMIGRLRGNLLTVYGCRTWDNARTLLTSVNSNMILEDPLNLDFNWEIKPNSDHHPFYTVGIPYLMPHTGLHDDYHRPRDDAHKINAAGMESVTRFTYQAVIEIDQLEIMPRFRDMSKRETPRAKKAFELPLPPPEKRLGVRWASENETQNGLQVTFVDRYSPAAKAGVRRGDRILEVNGKPVTNDSSMQYAVFIAPAESKLTVLPDGEEDSKILDVTMRGLPLRLGLSWREDVANPRTAMISRVISGSPADLAGLQPADRIHAINGKQWESDWNNKNPFQDLPLPIFVKYERQGNLKSTRIESGYKTRLNPAGN